MLLSNVLRATTPCTFSTSQLPKVVRSWGVLYLFTSKSASRHNGVQLFISHLPSCLRTRRFSEPTFQPSGATKPRKNTVSRDFPTFSRTCIFFLLIFSLLTLLPADCFFISPYFRKFDFETSFDYCISYWIKNSHMPSGPIASHCISQPNNIQWPHLLPTMPPKIRSPSAAKPPPLTAAAPLTFVGCCSIPTSCPQPSFNSLLWS